MKKLQYVLSGIYFLMISMACTAQDKVGNEDVPHMADGLRASGKIYVVVAIVVTILAGVIIYLVQIDKKISRRSIFKILPGVFIPHDLVCDVNLP